MTTAIEKVTPPILDPKKAFDITIKGPKMGKSFEFVAIPIIRADTLYDNMTDGFSIRSFSSKRFESPDHIDNDKSDGEIQLKKILKKETLKNSNNNSFSKDNSFASTPDNFKKARNSILKKSKYAESETNRGVISNRRKSLAMKEPPQVNTEDESPRKTKLKFKEEIQEVRIVENWKHYNQETSIANNTCTCNVF